MYIQKAEIKNIKSIVDFQIEFKNPAGWHVLIGDNGAGKSTIIRSMALALVGPTQAYGLRLDWEDWLNKEAGIGKTRLYLLLDSSIDEFKLEKDSIRLDFDKDKFFIETVFERNHGRIEAKDKIGRNLEAFGRYGITHSWRGFFSVAYGPYRRFEGGNSEAEKLFKSESYKDLAAHMSVFSESIALTEPIDWLRELRYKSFEKKRGSQHTLDNIAKLINSEDKDGSFLPHNAKLKSVTSDGVFFEDGNDKIISINQMSDGYRSILSMTFELIRQLVRAYGSDLVFKNIEKGEMFIDLPGVVMIDEIDAHLHPTWQTRIGQWFLKYFPKLQFIVTTHSPLVCRAAENGSIWRLAAPGSKNKSGEITGDEFDQLIYGNVLDAYGTGVFGENTTISKDSNELLNRLSELNVKSMMGLIEDEESEELQKLRLKFPTENKIRMPNELNK